MYAKKIKKIDGYSVFNYCILFFLLFMFWSFYLLGLTSYGLSGLVKNWNVNIFSALMTLALSAFIFFGVMDKSKQILPIKGLANTLMWILMFLVTMSAVSSGFIVALQFPTNELALEIFGFKNSVLENIILFLNNGWVFILSALLSIWYYWTKRNVYVVQPGSIAATYKGEVKRAGEKIKTYPFMRTFVVIEREERLDQMFFDIKTDAGNYGFKVKGSIHIDIDRVEQSLLLGDYTQWRYLVNFFSTYKNRVRLEQDIRNRINLCLENWLVEENRDLGYVIQKLELMLWENDYFVLGSSVRWQGKVVKAEFEVSPKRFNKS